MSRSLSQTVLKGVKFNGRYQYSVATTAFAAVPIIVSGLDDRAAALSDVYASARFAGVKIQVVPREVTEINLAVYFNSPTGSTPTSVEELQDMPFYAVGTGLYGCPVPEITITRKQLEKLRQVKWYNTQPSSTDNEFEYQFIIYSYAPFGTLNHVVKLEYMIEYAAPADPTQTVSNWRERQRLARSKSSGLVFHPRAKELCDEKTDDYQLIPCPGSAPAEGVVAKSSVLKPQVQAPVLRSPATKTPK